MRASIWTVMRAQRESGNGRIFGVVEGGGGGGVVVVIQRWRYLEPWCFEQSPDDINNGCGLPMTRRRDLGKLSESRNNFERVYRGNPNCRDVSLCSWSSRAGRLEVLVLTVDEEAGKKTSHRTTYDEQPTAGIVGVLGTAGVGAAGSASLRTREHDIRQGW